MPGIVDMAYEDDDDDDEVPQTYNLRILQQWFKKKTPRKANSKVTVWILHLDHPLRTRTLTVRLSHPIEAMRPWRMNTLPSDPLAARDSYGRDVERRRARRN